VSIVLGANTTDRGECAAAASIDNLTAFTILMWTHPTTLTTNRTFASKKNAVPEEGWLFTLHSTQSARLIFEFIRDGTDMIFVTSVGGPMVAGIDTFLAASVDQAAGTPCHIYYGTRSAAATEVSYSATQAGTNPFTLDDGAPLVWGNRSTFNQALQGRYNFAAYVARVMGLDEIRRWQFEPSPLFPNTVDFHEFGVESATANHTDLSGNGNTCVLTGTTLGEHIALPAKRQVHTMAALQRAGSW
jgi:hypothetical protein